MLNTNFDTKVSIDSGINRGSNMKPWIEQKQSLSSLRYDETDITQVKEVNLRLGGGLNRIPKTDYNSQKKLRVLNEF